MDKVNFDFVERVAKAVVSTIGHLADCGLPPQEPAGNREAPGPISPGDLSQCPYWDPRDRALNRLSAVTYGGVAAGEQRCGTCCQATVRHGCFC